MEEQQNKYKTKVLYARKVLFLFGILGFVGAILFALIILFLGATLGFPQEYVIPLSQIPFYMYAVAFFYFWFKAMNSYELSSKHKVLRSLGLLLPIVNLYCLFGMWPLANKLVKEKDSNNENDN